MIILEQSGEKSFNSSGVHLCALIVPHRQNHPILPTQNSGYALKCLSRINCLATNWHFSKTACVTDHTSHQAKWGLSSPPSLPSQSPGLPPTLDLACSNLLSLFPPKFHYQQSSNTISSSWSFFKSKGYGLVDQDKEMGTYGLSSVAKLVTWKGSRSRQSG